MFQFRRFPSIRYGLAYGCMRYAHTGFPIQTSADQWIFAPPAAFRSLSRLSSALSAKASTLRSFLLDLVYSFYSVRNWVFAFNNADRIASILNFRSFGLVVNFVYDILGCLDKKSFSSKSSVWSFQGTIANFVRIRNCFAISATSAFFNAFVTVWLNVYQSLETSMYWNL